MQRLGANAASQTKPAEGRQAGAAAPASVHQVLRSAGRPLDQPTREFMENRLGHDFGRVQVHVDSRAAASAQEVGSAAYTVGQHIAFASGRFRPNTIEGKYLLAHELVHTAQQERIGNTSANAIGNLTMGSEHDSSEREAHNFATFALRQHQGAGVRRAVTAPFRNPILQRAPVPTMGGEWSAEGAYEAVKDVDQDGNPLPTAQGWRGANITLTFKPNSNVNAELLGLTQSVQSYVGGALALTPAAATRAIPAKDARAINTGKGETDEGTALDMAPGFNSPIYPVQSVTSATLADNNTAPSWGQNGFHFIDHAKHVKEQDATLTDTPRRAGAQKDSRQIFEVTALATKGVQAGTYYGSVRWGWRTDAHANLTKIDLQKVSDGVPSSTFIKAAGIWDKGVSSTGAANVKLQAPEIMMTATPVKLNPQAAVMLPIALPVGTRVQILNGFNPPFLPNSGTVKVVDGPYAGLVGDISEPPFPSPILIAERP